MSESTTPDTAPDTESSVISVVPTSVPAASPTPNVAIDRDPWLWWRQQMPITEKWAYFDHAAVAPLPSPAAAAINQFAVQAAQEGDTVWPDWSKATDTLRRQFATLLNSGEDEVCLLPNTTAGINLVAEGLDWRERDSVVLPEGEFPSNLFPWMNQQSKGVDVRIVPRRDGRVLVDDLLNACDETTRMIAASWVGYASGFRIDVDQLVRRAHERGILVFLDAIQGLGIYPLDVQKTAVDFLAADGHKWLLGPEGAGVGMIRREHLPRLRCNTVGWNSVKAAHNFSHAEMDLRNAASRYEGGSANMVGLAALSASVELFLQVRRHHGEDAIMNRVIGLADYLTGRLKEAGTVCHTADQFKHRSGIVTFEVPGCDPAELRKAALERQIVLSCRGGGVRASIHAYNAREELDRLVDLVNQFVSGARECR